MYQCLPRSTVQQSDSMVAGVALTAYDFSRDPKMQESSFGRLIALLSTESEQLLISPRIYLDIPLARALPGA